MASLAAVAYVSQSTTLSARSLRIRDHYSPRNRHRPHRPHTRYIVLHTTEGPEAGSLRKVWRRGEAHYFVGIDGDIYRIIHKSKIATHAGRSMWQGNGPVDEYALGIEIVGFHDRELNAAQYEALRELLQQLQSLYNIPDERVLTHSMVAYGRPNRFHPYSHRGRKRCGMIFARSDVRARLGLRSSPTTDADVDAGRLRVADLELQRYLFDVETATPTAVVAAVGAGDGTSVGAGDEMGDGMSDGTSGGISAGLGGLTGGISAEMSDGMDVAMDVGMGDGTSDGTNGGIGEGLHGIITRKRSAWLIARDQYDSAGTLYTFPDGTTRAGNEIDDWRRIPPGTRVTVLVEQEESEFEGFRVAGEQQAARSLAGDAYAAPTTIYILPNGMVRTGREMARRRATQKMLDDLPKGTRVLVGYIYGGYVTRNRLPVQIAGRKWNYPSTFYRLPNGKTLSGDEIDAAGVPANTLVFFQR